MGRGIMRVIDLTPSMSAASFDGGGVGDLCARCGQAEILMRPGSGWGGAGVRSEQLEQVVGKADDGPLPADFLKAAQPESAKAAPLLDLSEHGLRDSLAPGIHCPPGRGLQLAPHRLAEGPLPVAAGRGFATVRVPIR